MNFLQKIKSQISDMEKRQGLRNQILVDSRALNELIYHFEKLDSLVRMESICSNKNPNLTIEEHLHHVLHAAYAQNQDGELLLLKIIRIIEPLIEEKRKRKQINQIFERY